jgi:hypothetical protein
LLSFLPPVDSRVSFFSPGSPLVSSLPGTQGEASTSNPTVPKVSQKNILLTATGDRGPAVNPPSSPSLFPGFSFVKKQPSKHKLERIEQKRLLKAATAQRKLDETALKLRRKEGNALALAECLQYEEDEAKKATKKIARIALKQRREQQKALGLPAVGPTTTVVTRSSLLPTVPVLNTSENPGPTMPSPEQTEFVNPDDDRFLPDSEEDCPPPSPEDSRRDDPSFHLSLPHRVEYPDPSSDDDSFVVELNLDQDQSHRVRFPRTSHSTPRGGIQNRIPRFPSDSFRTF